MKIKYFLLLFFLMCFGFSLKASPIPRDTYTYFNYGSVFNLDMNVLNDSIIIDAVTNLPNQSKNKASSKYDTFYNSFLAVGVRLNNATSFEIELREYDILFKKINGVNATNRDFNLIKYKMTSLGINTAYDFFTALGTTFFVKGGVGFMQLSPVEDVQQGSGGLSLYPSYLLGTGAYVGLLSNLDFQVDLSYIANVPKRKQEGALGYSNKTSYNELSLIFGLKFKLHFGS